MNIAETVKEMQEKEGGQYVLCMAVFDEKTKLITTTVETHNFPVNDIPTARNQISKNLGVLHQSEVVDTLERPIKPIDTDKLAVIEELQDLLE